MESHLFLWIGIVVIGVLLIFITLRQFSLVLYHRKFKVGRQDISLFISKVLGFQMELKGERKEEFQKYAFNPFVSFGKANEYTSGFVCENDLSDYPSKSLSYLNTAFEYLKLDVSDSGNKYKLVKESLFEGMVFSFRGDVLFEQDIIIVSHAVSEGMDLYALKQGFKDSFNKIQNTSFSQKPVVSLELYKEMGNVEWMKERFCHNQLDSSCSLFYKDSVSGRDLNSLRSSGFVHLLMNRLVFFPEHFILQLCKDGEIRLFLPDKKPYYMNIDNNGLKRKEMYRVEIEQYGLYFEVLEELICEIKKTSST